MTSVSRHERISGQLVDLKMPGALEALDEVLRGVDSGSLTGSEAIEKLLGAQILLRNIRRLEAAMRSSRLPAVKTRGLGCAHFPGGSGLDRRPAGVAAARLSAGAVRRRQMLRAWLLAAMLVAAGCGGGADGPAPTSLPAPAAPEPRPEPRVCTNERELALAYLAESWPPPQLVQFWDGTPIRVHMDETRIPEAQRPHAEHMLAVVERFSDQIKDQLGYSIVEPAGWIGEDDGFTIEIDGVEIGPCETSEPGRRAVFTAIPEYPATGAASAACAVAWFKTFDLPADYLAPHELFHLFGFRHSEETHPQERDWGGIPMSRGLTTGVNAAGTDYVAGTGVAFEDIDALRCVLPEGGP